MAPQEKGARVQGQAAGKAGIRFKRPSRTPAAPETRSGRRAVEQADLLQRAGKGDAAAEDRLLRLYLPLVAKLARTRTNGPLPVEDLIQEGSLGLLAAIRGFAGSAQVDFGAYASQLVSAKMDAALVQEDTAEREAARLLAAAEQLDRTEYRLAAELQRKPTNDELAKRLDWSLERVELVGELVLEARRRHDEELLQYLELDSLEPAEVIAWPAAANGA